MISSGNRAGDNKVFEWSNTSANLSVAGTLTSSVSPSTAMTSITISGSSSAQRGFSGDPNFENQNITQTYTINVDTNGNLSIDKNGTKEKCPNNVGIAIAGSKTINGTSLTLDYDISGAEGGGAQIVAANATIMGTGGTLEWTNAINKLSGELSITFQAVE